MKNLHLKSAAISAVLAYVLGVAAFISSFFVSILSDPELQANLVLMFAIIPAAAFGAHIYYRKGHQTHGLVLGMAMFFGTMILDALITVPIFIMPNGGNHIDFFTDPGFWLIGLEYVAVVAIYWHFAKSTKSQSIAQR